MTFINNQKGDTLIEVIIAISVLSIVLVSLYTLMTDAFKLSMQSQDRSQATNYVQVQTEGLRALRDSNSWDDFTSMLPSTGNNFHLERSGDNWSIDSGRVNYDGRYNIEVVRQLTTNSNEEAFLISAQWDRIGGGSDNTRAEFKLANLEFDEFPVGNSTGSSSPPTPPPPTGSGVCGYYYSDQSDNNHTNSESPPDSNFEGTPIVRHDNVIEFSWGNGVSPMSGISDDYFSVRWVGEINIPTPGNYTFYTTSDDGIRLRINNSTVIEEWYPHGPREHSGSISFATPGRKSLEIELYERTGQAVSELRWESATINKQIVPRDNLFPPDGNTACDSPGFQEHMIGAAAFSDGGDNRPSRRNESNATLQSNESSYNMRAFPWGGSYPGNSSSSMTWTGDTIEFNQIRVRARGENYRGWPIMEVYVDGVRVYSRRVNSSSYDVFVDNIPNQSAGSHTIVVNFSNDACCGSNGEDRNLYVDYVELRSP